MDSNTVKGIMEEIIDELEDYGLSQVRIKSNARRKIGWARKDDNLHGRIKHGSRQRSDKSADRS